MPRPINPHSAGHYRNPPDDEDWLRAQLMLYLDRDLAPGDDLNALVQAMPSSDYKRLMNRWRVRLHRRYKISDDRLYNGAGVLSPLWRKVIDLGLITEEQALSICRDTGEDGWSVWSDTGCRLTFSCAITNAAEKAQKRINARTNSPISPFHNLDPAGKERAVMRQELKKG